MPYRILCNGVKREYVRTSPDQAPGFSALYRYTKFGMASHGMLPPPLAGTQISDHGALCDLSQFSGRERSFDFVSKER